MQAYDTLDQVVCTVVGQTYDVSFDYAEDGPYALFSRLGANRNTAGDGGLFHVRGCARVPQRVSPQAGRSNAR